MPKAFTPYADSPLAKLLTQGLQTILHLKQKYAADLADADTVEKLSAKGFFVHLDTSFALS